jgi:hypothetical protein
VCKEDRLRNITREKEYASTGVEHPAHDDRCLQIRYLLLDTLFCLLQSSLGRLQLIGECQQSRVVDAQQRACAHQCLGEGIDPSKHRIELTLEGNEERDRAAYPLLRVEKREGGGRKEEEKRELKSSNMGGLLEQNRYEADCRRRSLVDLQPPQHF